MADGERVGRAALPLRLIALLTLAHLSFSGARLALTLSAVHLHASPLAVGVLMSLLMVVPMFVAVPIGRWADRVGFFRPALIGFTLLSAAGVAAAGWGTLPVLGAASVLIGSGYMLAHVAVTNAIGRASSPDSRSHAFGAMALAFSLSGLAGPMVAGFAIDHASHAAAFAAMAVLPVVSALLLVVPRRLPHHATAEAKSATSSGVLDLLRDPPLRAVFVVTAMLSMGWDLFSFIVPLHGVRIGLSPSAIGVVVGAFGAGAFAVRLAMPWITRSFDEWQVLCAALALTAVCYLAFPFSERLATLLPLAFVLGTVLGCGQPLGMSLVHVTAPPARTGEAAGVRSTITSMSQTVLPLVFGALGSALGMLPVFWTAATVLGAGSAYAMRRRPR